MSGCAPIGAVLAPSWTSIATIAWPHEPKRSTPAKPPSRRSNPRREADSDLARGNQASKALEASIVGALDIFGEAAGGELPHTQVVAQALAADALPFTARIGALAEPRVARLLAFHSLRVVLRPCGVNSACLPSGRDVMARVAQRGNTGAAGCPGRERT